MWTSIEAFDFAITKPYINPRKEIGGKQYIEINDFEYKLRERIVLERVSDRGGQLPEPKLKN